MSVILPAIKHQFAAILRCRTWCDWPESSRYISQAYEEPLCFLNGDRVFLSVHLVTYARRTRPEIKPALPLESTWRPILWRGQMAVGYWLGAHFIEAPKDTLPLSFRYEPPHEGDLDIQLHIGAVAGAPIHQLIEIVSKVCTSMLAFINLALGELAPPVAPLHVLALREEGCPI
jgi:hypothetical protein